MVVGVDQQPRSQPRAVARALALLAVVLGLAASSTATVVQAQERSSGQVQRELDEAQQRRDGVAADLGDLRAELSAAEEELAAVGARLADAQQRLTLAEGQVSLAELALAEAEAARDRAVVAHVRALDRLAQAEQELATQEDLLTAHLVHTFKYGSSGAQAGAMALEILRRAEDPNAFSVAMKHLETVVGVQDDTVRTYHQLRDRRERRSVDAARARAQALQAEAAAADTLQVVEELREEAATVAAEVATEQQAQQALVANLRTTEAETQDLLRRVQARTDQLGRELAAVRAAEEAAARRAREDAARAAGTAGGGRLSTPGAAGGPGISGIVCPVQGAVAGRDFSNDWGYPRSGGRFHQGNDIFAARGTPVVAVQDATVVRWNPPSSPTALGGITVTYRTADGSEWYNAHLDSVAAGVQPGASLSRGQPIGTVGNTGNARTTPPHLHLGRRHGGVWVNPWPTISPVC